MKKVSFKALREIHSLMLGHCNAFGDLLDEADRRAEAEGDTPPPAMDEDLVMAKIRNTYAVIPGLKRFG